MWRRSESVREMASWLFLRASLRSWGTECESWQEVVNGDGEVSFAEVAGEWEEVRT